MEITVSYCFILFKTKLDISHLQRNPFTIFFCPYMRSLDLQINSCKYLTIYNSYQDWQIKVSRMNCPSRKMQKRYTWRNWQNKLKTNIAPTIRMQHTNCYYGFPSKRPTQVLQCNTLLLVRMPRGFTDKTTFSRKWFRCEFVIAWGCFIAMIATERKWVSFVWIMR